MLTFNEGVPRSGKSYDAVKTHILPAVKAGRMVYARLNGLHHDRIAAYLNMAPEEVRRLLVHVDTAQVHDVFAAVRDDEGQWVIPAHLKDALFVIDEVHEFYKAGRQSLEDRHEQFFALHGQNGMDGVILTQAYKRLHGVIRARIERKQSFQKMTALGMRGTCRVTRWVTIAPDKYEKLGASNFRYDKAIYPLYAGYAEGVTNTEVYEAGSRSAFRRLLLPSLVMVPLSIWAVTFLLSFFTGGTSTPLVKDGHASIGAPRTAAPASSTNSPAPSIPSVSAAVSQAKAVPDMPPGAAHVFDLAKLGRPRLAGVYQSSRRTLAVIEWRDKSGNVHERLTSAQIEELGVQVFVSLAGARLVHGDTVQIVTSWPVEDDLRREDRPRTYDTSGARASSPSIIQRDSSPAPMVPSGPSMVPTAGGSLVSAGSPRVGSNREPIR